MYANYKRQYQQSVDFKRYKYNIRIQMKYIYAGHQVAELVIKLFLLWK